MAADTYHLMCVGGDEVGVAVEREVTREEEEYCNLAVQYYSRGQEVLKKAKTDRSIWYSIESDLAAVHFTLAQQLQERPPLSRRNLSEVHVLYTHTHDVHLFFWRIMCVFQVFLPKYQLIFITACAYDVCYVNRFIPGHYMYSS